MKANNAPEKIWINHSDLPKLSGYIDRDSIEYTRTDAFVEKAATWFANRYQVNGYLDADDIEDFKNYMKGE